MTVLRAAATGVAALLLVSACGVEATPGTITSQTFRSLDARGDDLTPADAKDAGAVEDDELAQRFGGAEPSADLCLYAAVTYREKDRGVARFCFDGDSPVAVERNRTDLD